MVIGAQDPLGVYLCRELQRHRAVVHAVFHDSPQLARHAYEIAGMQLLQEEAPVVEHSVADTNHDLLGSLMMETLPDEIYWVNDPPEMLHVSSADSQWADRRVQKASSILESYREYCVHRGASVPLVHTVQGWPAGFGSGPSWSGRRAKQKTIASIGSSAQSLVRTVCRGYREKHQLWVSNVALSLNESPLDGAPSTLRKIVRAAIRACAGLPAALCLGDPDEVGDWGFTGDYATAIRLIAQQDAPNDFYVATGNILSLRQVLESVFGRFGLCWEDHCELDPAKSLPALPDDHLRSVVRFQEAAGWQPGTSFEDLVEMLIQTEQAEVAAEVLSCHGASIDPGSSTIRTHADLGTAVDTVADGTISASAQGDFRENQLISGVQPQVPLAPLLSLASTRVESELPIGHSPHQATAAIANRESSENCDVESLPPAPEIVPGRLLIRSADANPVRRVAVLGHRGMIGSAIVRRLFRERNTELCLHPTRGFDLTSSTQVEQFIEDQRPAELYLAAGRVAGDRTRCRLMADFLRENLQITLNVLDACARFGVEKVMLFNPESLASEGRDAGLLRETACLKQAAEAYRHQFGIPVINVFPSPVYGAAGRLADDSLSPVLATVSRMLQAIRQEAAFVTLAGNQYDLLDVLDSDSLADAAIFLMQRCRFESVSVVAPWRTDRGTVASTLARLLGFRGEVVFDGRRPGSARWQGPPMSAIDLGWRFPQEAADSLRWMANSYRVQYLEGKMIA
ncbi:MAG: NAD-dependent epimerase/dehydratase family protein [Bryobacterales bacterium]|nr:NAD-dependent epimerase/dehydratase family protein [Bryobacterales bacterium]